jgi:hypothetical protein
VPSEHSSGASVKRGGLTKAGNSAARRLLIEAAWTYRSPARVSRELRLRQEEQPRAIREIAWKAQLRLCALYRKFARSGKPANVVTVRSLVSWQASSGPSPGAGRQRQADRRKSVRASQGGASKAPDMLLPGQGWGRGRGQENPRIHYLPGRRSDPGP